MTAADRPKTESGQVEHVHPDMLPCLAGCPAYGTRQGPLVPTGEVPPLVEREAQAYRAARRRLRHLHTSLSGRRQDWANNTEQPCSSARAVAYQSAMQSVLSIIDEIEAIAAGVR